MERLSLDLSLLLKTINHVLVAPSNLVRETLLSEKNIFSFVRPNRNNSVYLHSAVLATRLQSENAKGFRNNHPLLLIVGRGDTLKEFETLQRSSAASSLVGNHTTNGTVENLGWCAVVEGAGLFGVDNVTFV
jgi:hypothetical protein